jgi:hypothetical protein
MTTPTFTTPPVIVPTRGSPTYSVDASAWVTFQNAFEGELSTAMPWVAARVVEVAQSVTDATTQVGLATDQVGLATDQVGLATDQVGLATTQAGNAAVSATAAAATAGAVAWVSAASYTAIISNVVSPVDFGTYRAKTTHTGETTDPSADATNWEIISARALSSQAVAEAGTDNAASMSPLRTKQAIDALVAFASQAEAEAGTNNTKSMTPLRAAQAIAALAPAKPLFDKSLFKGN